MFQFTYLVSLIFLFLCNVRILKLVPNNRYRVGPDYGQDWKRRAQLTLVALSFCAHTTHTIPTRIVNASSPSHFRIPGKTNPLHQRKFDCTREVLQLRAPFFFCLCLSHENWH